MSATKRTEKSTPKKTPSKKAKSKSTFEKGKVYIPRYKTIFFCVCVIVVCVTLLLITSIKNDKKVIAGKENQKTEQVAKTTEKKIVESENTKLSAESAKSNSIIANSTTTKTTKDSKQSEKTETVRSETKKTENSKSSSTVKDVKSVQPVKVEPPKAIEQKSETSKTVNNKTEQVKTDNQQKVSPSVKNTQSQSQQQQIQKTGPVDTFNFPDAVNHAQLVFIFDDGGQNLSHLNRFLKLPFPITIAVLPKLVHSKESAQKIRTSGNEVMLHQPMQSINPKVNPGPGAITPGMSEDQIISTLFQNITEIGPISGVNNHEGSAITADAEKMAVVMKTVNEEGLYFLDSRTNVETKVPYVAKEMGYHYYERNIFLDNEKTRENALTELKKGLNIANKNGVVIMIGHVWSADFLPAFLEEVYPELVRKGYTFKTVSNSKARK